MGLVGGVFVGNKNPLAGAIGGVVADLLITGASLFYLSWRSTVMMVEIIVPLLTGLVGITVYNLLKKKS